MTALSNRKLWRLATMTADSTWHFAGRLEGYKLERFAWRLRGTRPDGSIWLERTELTEALAQIAFYQIAEDAHKTANAGGHL
jgi:hypothetical protein